MVEPKTNMGFGSNEISMPGMINTNTDMAKENDPINPQVSYVSTVSIPMLHCSSCGV